MVVPSSEHPSLEGPGEMVSDSDDLLLTNWESDKQMRYAEKRRYGHLLRGCSTSVAAGFF
jgi:hypothetical protein